MKITYTKAEALEIMRNHIADLLDVQVTEITVSNYSEDYMNVTCTKIDKPKRASRWIKDESYRDPPPSSEEINRLFSAHDALRAPAPTAPQWRNCVSNGPIPRDTDLE